MFEVLFYIYCQHLQKLLARTVTTAIELGDQRHLHRSATHGQLLTTMAAVAESYLREYLRRIATASKINKKLQQMWQNTAQVGMI